MTPNAGTENLSVASFPQARARQATAIRIRDILHQALKVFFARWQECFGIMALGYAPLYAMTAAGRAGVSAFQGMSEANALGYVETVTLVLWLVSALVCPLLAFAAVSFGAEQELSGRRFALVESLSATLRRCPAILGTFALTGVGVTVGTIFAVVSGVIVLCMFAVAVPACVAERLGPIRSVTRSTFLTWGNRWRVLGVLSILYGGVAAFLAFDVLLSPSIGGAAGGYVLAARLVYFAIAGLIWLALSGFFAVAVGVLHARLRIAREGVHVDLAKVFD